MKVAFYTLGCKVNQYETQAIKEQLEREGYQIGGENGFADIYVINTCTVTGLADRKSRQYIRRAKKNNPDCITVVMGCYAQMNPQEAAEIAGVDIIIGTNEKTWLAGALRDFIAARQVGQEDVQISRIQNTDNMTEYEETGMITFMESRIRAFIKIQEGCDRFCSYCIIPYARGRIRSRDPQDIIQEAKKLISQGFREIVLTGINTALYGEEEGFQSTYSNVTLEYKQTGSQLESLIEKLSDLPGDFRIRLGSLEPTVVDVNYVQRLLKYPKLCAHLHLSLQSGSDSILKAMNRPYTQKSYFEIVELLRAHDPGFGVTTDIIVGFPGETQEDFMASLDLVKQVGFVKTHVFPYSKRRGTPAAEMPGQIDASVKKLRVADLTQQAEAAAKSFFESNLGTYRTVLFEEYDPETLLIHGFSDNYIKVFCKVSPIAAESLLNSFIRVYLKKATNDGILGEIS